MHKFFWIDLLILPWSRSNPLYYGNLSGGQEQHLEATKRRKEKSCERLLHYHLLKKLWLHQTFHSLNKFEFAVTASQCSWVLKSRNYEKINLILKSVFQSTRVRSLMTSKCGKNKKVAHEAQPSVSLMWHVLCDLLLNRTWNLFVLYNKELKYTEKKVLMITSSIRLSSNWS